MESWLMGTVMNWMFVPPFPDSYVEALNSNAMVFGGRDFGKQLGLDEVMAVSTPYRD